MFFSGTNILHTQDGSSRVIHTSSARHVGRHNPVGMATQRKNINHAGSRGMRMLNLAQVLSRRSQAEMDFIYPAQSLDNPQHILMNQHAMTNNIAQKRNLQYNMNNINIQDGQNVDISHDVKFYNLARMYPFADCSKCRKLDYHVYM